MLTANKVQGDYFFLMIEIVIVKWQPTPVFLPGESQGQRSLVGCHLWGLTESDMTEANDPMHCSTLGFPVLHHLAEFAQTHIH